MLELEAIFAATSERRSLTVCADEKQQILSFVDATGFANFKNQLHTLGLERENLTVSYRSAKEIMDLACKVSGRHVDTSNSHSGVVEFHKTKNFEEAAVELRKIVQNLIVVDPNSLTAVICKKKADVKVVQKTLAGIPGLHKDGEISFAPGAMVTHCHQVKGVEFTNVILWNPSDTDYRQTVIDTNLLYVSITRACRSHIIYWKPLAKALR